MCEEIVFPDLIEWNDYQEYNSYEDALLNIYKRDLWDSGLMFNGLGVIPRVHKRFEWRGKLLDWTFAHFTSKGKIEEDRDFDLRRCERIGWVKPIIENAHLECVKVYENSRFDKNGIPINSVVLWCECANAKVVLTRINRKKKDHYVITTFYTVNNPHQINRHNKEYAEYVKNNGEFNLAVAIK